MDRQDELWTRIYVDNFGRLHAQVLNRLTKGNVADAEDVASEAFCRLMRYLPHPEAIDNITGYLWAAAKNVWFDRFKKVDPDSFVSFDDLNNEPMSLPVQATVQQTLEDEESRRVLKDKVLKAPGKLLPREKQLLKLRFEGKDCQETADFLGEDVRIIKYEMNALKAKLSYRIKKSL